MATVEQEFERLGGKMVDGYPVIDSEVFETEKGTPYLKAPGVAMMTRPQTNLKTAKGFLDGYGSMGFGDYLNDPAELGDAERLIKFAGQLCYASFGPGRTWNVDARQYFGNIIDSGHGSVLEHACFSFLWYGVSRSVTHEVVRHRAGMAYSQQSLRYISGKALRFVERPEYQKHWLTHTLFEKRIDTAAWTYEQVIGILMSLQKEGEKILAGEAKTDLRKKVRQAARSVLPNETEAPIVLTGNVRSLRHISSMRASPHAEIEIREAAYRTFLCLAVAVPALMNDYEITELTDGTKGVMTKYPKV